MISSDVLYIAFNSILFLRQVCPRRSFNRTKKWGVPIVVCSLPEVQEYIKSAIQSVLAQWISLENSGLNEVALSIIDHDSNAIERWQFIFDDREGKTDTEQQRKDIQTLLREISSSVSFLPILIGTHTFKITIIDSANRDIPKGWTSSNMLTISNAIQGTFQPIEAERHRIVPKVTYSR